MKIKQIALGCSLVCAALSASAAGTVNVNGVPHELVYLSGATAPDGFLGDIAESMLTGVTYYENVSGNGAFQHRAYAGSANSVPGVANGTKVLFVKRSKGGSVMGVNPVARAQRVESIDVNNCTTGAGTAASPFRCAVVGIDPGTPGANTAANTGLVPDFGVSDVEAAMFQEPYNTENDTPALSATEAGRLVAKPVNQIMMGLAATNTLPLSTVLTRANYGAILSNQVQTWDQVDSSLSGDVAVCRRVEGSGTQTSYNWYFNNFPCASAQNGTKQPARMTDSYGWKYSDAATDGLPNAANQPASGTPGSATNPYVIEAAAGFTVVENSGSGDVRNCLKAANAGTNHYVKAFDPEEQKENYFVVTFANSGPMKAVGVLSLDSYTKTDGWAFRSLNGAGSYDPATDTLSAGATGVAPSKANLIGGSYDFAVEVSMQYRNVAVSNEQGDNVASIGGVQKAFADEFIARAGAPKYTGNFEAASPVTSTPEAYASLPQYYAGLTDNVGSPTDGNGVRYADLHVARFSRGANTCAPMQFFGN